LNYARRQQYRRLSHAGAAAAVTPRVADARQEVVRGTRAAEAIFAAVLSQETGSDGGDIEAMLRSDALLEGV
jgi:hypothetical protein